MGANHQPLTLDRRPITRNTLHWQHFEEYKNILKSVEYTQRYTYLANALLGCLEMNFRGRCKVSKSFLFSQL